jgi:hypothetical protein
MTRKDFQLIADVLKPWITRDGTPGVEDALCASIARDFADKLASTNPNFDRERFLRACGVEG